MEPTSTPVSTVAAGVTTTNFVADAGADEVDGAEDAGRSGNDAEIEEEMDVEITEDVYEY